MRSAIYWIVAFVVAAVVFGVPCACGEVILQCDAGIGVVQDGWTQLMIGTTSNVAGTGIDVTLMTGNPFVVEVEQGHCGDLNSDEQIDLDDLQAVAGILLEAGSPFVVPCE